MVSFDAVDRNRAFAESLGTSQLLLSDPEGAVARAYGVAGIGGLFAKRWTFYIDPDGIIRYIDKDVRVDTAGRDIATRLGELGFPRRGAAPEAPDAGAPDGGGP